MQRGFETVFDTHLSILWHMPSSPLALLGLSPSIIFSILSSVQFILEKILSESLVNRGSWVSASLTVEIDAKKSFKQLTLS